MNTSLVVAAILSLIIGHLMDKAYPMHQRQDEYVRSYFWWVFYCVLFGLGAWLCIHWYIGFNDYRY